MTFLYEEDDKAWLTYHLEKDGVAVICKECFKRLEEERK